MPHGTGMADGGGVHHSDHPGVGYAVEDLFHAAHGHSGFLGKSRRTLARNVTNTQSANFVGGKSALCVIRASSTTQLWVYENFLVRREFGCNAPENIVERDDCLHSPKPDRWLTRRGEFAEGAVVALAHPYIPSMVTGVFSTMRCAISGRGLRSMRIQLATVLGFAFRRLAKASTPICLMYSGSFKVSFSRFTPTLEHGSCSLGSPPCTNR